MDHWLVNQVSPFLAGAACSALLLCGAAMLGATWLNRRGGTARIPADVAELLRTLEQLSRWTHGFSSQMTEYGQTIMRVTQHLQQAQDQPMNQETVTTLLGQLVAANEVLQQRLHTAEQNLERQSCDLANYLSEAHTDSLTNLANRRLFDVELPAQIQLCQLQAAPLSLLLVDIDHFKSFNDRYGHLAGDTVLRQVGQCLKASLRPTDLVSRFGGEEFAALLLGAAEDRAALIADRTRQIIQDTQFTCDEQSLHVTISCGVTSVRAHDQAAHLLGRADAALYAAKRTGRNRTCWHDGHRIRSLASPQDQSGAVQEVVPATETACPEPVTTIEPDPHSIQTISDFERTCDELRRKLEELLTR